MKSHHDRMPRLFVEGDLRAGERVAPTREQAHFLRHVMRLSDGARIRAFNGRDGEWLARIAELNRRDLALEVEEQSRPQTPSGNLHLLFAPLKHARLDYMVQKAVEMGASHLVPVVTRHTQVARLNLERMRSNVIEAAEQCGILSLPTVEALIPLHAAVETIEEDRRLVFCDEDAEQADPIATLARMKRGPLALLIGPEGGFADDERRSLLARPGTVRLSLGPRIMRADTAAVAALAVIQACVGDWAPEPD